MQQKQQLNYLGGYSAQIIGQVEQWLGAGRLGEILLARYPQAHEIRTDKALYDFTMALKQNGLRHSQPLSKVCYDSKIHVLHQALGLHTFVSRVQGGKLKAKHEIRIAGVFKTAPLALLKMIVVHELAHLKEKEHNKAFYQTCLHLEPDYPQLEFDARLYLTHLELCGPLYPAGPAPSL